MTITELIARLEKVLAEHGDLPVYVMDDMMEEEVTEERRLYVTGDGDPPKRLVI